MRPWDKHPPWAHWAFYVVAAIAGTFGPIALVAGLISGHAVWIGVVLCGVWVLDLVIDWVVVQRLRARNPTWSAWTPSSRWLRS